MNINGDPELFRNPKLRIQEAIRIGRAELPRKLRNSLHISELYSFLGQSIQIDNLRTLNSFMDFEKNVRKVLQELKILS